MKIISILNNSSLIALDDHGEECVCVGKGIAFQKHPGEFVNERLIEKVFGQKEKNELTELIESIPDEYFEMTNAIIRHIRKKKQMQIKSSLYIALADHINNAIERYYDHVNLPFAMLDEMNLLYGQDMSLARWAVEYINATLDIDLPDDEAGFIAMHIIGNSTSEFDSKLTKKILIFTKEVSDVTKNFVEVEEGTLNFNRYVTHVKYLAYRYFRHEQIQESESPSFTLSKDAIEKTKKIINEINRVIRIKFTQPLSEYEDKFLVLHLCRLMNIK